MTGKNEAFRVERPLKISRLRMAPATPWILSAAALVLLGARQVQAMRESAAKESLEPIASMLGLSANTPKNEIYARVSSSVAGREEVRKFRIARNVGLEPQWDEILAHLDKMSPTNRTTAVPLIAVECGLPTTSNFEDVRRYMTQQASIRRSRKAFGCVPAIAASAL